jgi:phenylpyruvate tautomerase PptA (4-oxalocrotonate tautomerase family)
MGAVLSAISQLWLAGVVALTLPAREPTPVVELTWSAPKSCPKKAEVLAKITELVERPLGQDPERTLVVTGKVTRTKGKYALVLVVVDRGAETTREFTAAKCRELLEPAAVVVAVAVDPVEQAPAEALIVPEPPATIEAEEVTPEPMPEAEPEVEVEAEPLAVADAPSTSTSTSTSTSQPLPRRRRARGLKAIVGVRGGVDGGNLPGVGGVLEGSVGVLVGPARFEVAVLHVFARRRERDDGTGGTFRVTAARPQGCFEPGVGRFAFPICGGVELGVMRAAGVGVERSETVRALWLGLVAGAGFVGAPLPWLALGVRAELVLTPLRREFTLDDDTLVTTGVAGGRGLAVIEVRLP